MTKAELFFQNIYGKRVAICGIGTNNTPVVLQFLKAGATVFACDRRSEEELGETATVVATGGLSKEIISYCKNDIIYNVSTQKV